MSLRRKKIREEMIKILKGRTQAGSNVRNNRSESNWAENLPAINIYMRGEDAEETDQAPRLLRRIVNAEIEIIAEGRDGDDLSDTLDELAEQVEQCLANDDSLNCAADDIILRRVSEMEAVSDGSKPTGSISLFYDVRYHLHSPRLSKDQMNLPDLQGFDADWATGHNEGPPTMPEDDQAKDIINF